jgi:hypothetical protein
MPQIRWAREPWPQGGCVQNFPRIKNFGRLKCSKKSSFLSNQVVVLSPPALLPRCAHCTMRQAKRTRGSEFRAPWLLYCCCCALGPCWAQPHLPRIEGRRGRGCGALTRSNGYMAPVTRPSSGAWRALLLLGCACCSCSGSIHVHSEPSSVCKIIYRLTLCCCCPLSTSGHHVCEHAPCYHRRPRACTADGENNGLP